jgi:hypothetical protein
MKLKSIEIYFISAVVALLLIEATVAIYGAYTLSTVNTKLLKENQRLKRKLNTNNQIIEVLEEDIKSCPYQHHLNIN